jgi:ParB/RepB/Spo0J family partition protein
MADSDSLVAKVIGVQQVATNELVPNPHNPRLLFDRDPMEALKSSIAKVGILVPLTVYRDSKTGRYVILDGQRRWTCARELGLPKVAVNEVEEPTLVQNIVTMFKIHKLREDWELMPTALKLELLMNELGDKSDRRLSAITDLPETVISRCKKLLSFPKKFQDLMLDPDPSARVKSDFFIELYPVLHDREVAKMSWFARAKFTDQMLAKYGPGRAIRSVTDFRLVKQHINNAKKSRKLPEFSRKLQEFAENIQVPVGHLEIESAQFAIGVKRKIAQVQEAIEMIKQLDPDEFIGEELLWTYLIELVKVTREKLNKADRRFSE